MKVNVLQLAQISTVQVMEYATSVSIHVSNAQLVPKFVLNVTNQMETSSYTDQIVLTPAQLVSLQTRMK